MFDPHDTLAVFAEVAIALAGFSGIVIAFGRRSFGSLSVLEVRRLSNLFTLSGMTLGASLLVMSLLHTPLAQSDQFWATCSAVMFILSSIWVAWDMVKVGRLDETSRSGVSTPLLVVFYGLAIVGLALQVANTFAIRASWPFFLALTLLTAGAFQQFILLVRMGMREDG
jgi:hypothetical protein